MPPVCYCWFLYVSLLGSVSRNRMPPLGIDLGLSRTGGGCAHIVDASWLTIHGVPDVHTGGTIHGLGRFVLSGPIARDEQRGWFQIGARFAWLYGGWAGVRRLCAVFLGRILLRIVGTQRRCFLGSQSGLWGLIAAHGGLLLHSALIGISDRAALGTTSTRGGRRRGKGRLFDNG